MRISWKTNTFYVLCKFFKTNIFYVKYQFLSFYIGYTKSSLLKLTSWKKLHEKVFIKTTSWKKKLREKVFI
jgi:hypothetical protein